ncbi:hypothetical protein [Nonomuraea rubra]|uniref:hypothetical protein n=1 Tax=Nonomuraea rubra TaxID=46180 RepID=UPI003406BACC
MAIAATAYVLTFAERDGGPHSPWRYGHSVRGLTKGLLFARVGWMSERDRTNRNRFAKDLLADSDIGRVDRFHVVDLIVPGIEHLNLLVIPPDTPPAAAHEALGLATRCRGRTRPGDILTAENRNGTADATAELELDLAGWDNEGGQPRQPARRSPAP